MKERIFSSLTILLMFAWAGLSAQTQKPSMSFEKKTHDFGKIKEAEGEVNTKFKFRNVGKQPVIIGKVRASCGCTSPTWSKKPIPPGTTGFIKAAFNPKNRPGRFNKSITVYSNAIESPVTLRIKGEVEPKPKSLEDIYRFKMDALRLKSNHAAFTRVYHNQKKSTSVGVVNVSNQPITIDFARVPKHITAKAVPQTLKPKQKGKLQLSYDASQVNKWGYNRDRLYIKINGTFDHSNRIYASASIRENFSKLTKSELQKAPKIAFETKSFNFGEIQEGKKVTHEFKFNNEGKTDLKIRKISASCGCTATSPSKRTIKPGSSGIIKATFNSAHKSGRQNKAITVITNDPKNSKQILWIKGKVN